MIIPEYIEKNTTESGSEEYLDAAFHLLTTLVDLKVADEIMPSSPQTVFTPSVTLWMLLVQRLKNGATLDVALQHLLDTYPDLLPDNKRVHEQKLSPSTAAYSNGRQRLTIDVVKWLAKTVRQSLIDGFNPTFHGRRVFLFDGTTITLSPKETLRNQFPPAANQYGESPWPTVNLVVAHEMESGVALIPELGAMYGPEAVSETALISQHLQKIPEGSVILADSAYGIFRVAYAADQTQNKFLLRMTKSRFCAQQRKATLTAEGPGWKSYDHIWRPSKRELNNNPQIPADAELKVRLHKIQQGDETLYLVTDLSEGAEELAALYLRRWDVETDISNLKLVLDIENIRAQSLEMFRKELIISVVAYNLCGQFRRQAAAAADVPPRRLSFTRVWTTFKIFLLDRISNDPATWRATFERALKIAMQHKIPHRPDRNYEREAYKRRPKSTHFKKREPP